MQSAVGAGRDFKDRGGAQRPGRWRAHRAHPLNKTRTKSKALMPRAQRERKVTQRNAGLNGGAVLRYLAWFSFAYLCDHCVERVSGLDLSVTHVRGGEPTGRKRILRCAMNFPNARLSGRRRSVDGWLSKVSVSQE